MGYGPRHAEGDRPRRLTVADDRAGEGLATRLANAGRRNEWTHDERIGGGIVNPPVWRASTILYDNVAALRDRGRDTHDKLYYGRRGTPTVWALCDALTELEPGAAGTLLFPSGVAAIATALIAMTKPGDDILVVDSAYEPTRAICDGLLKRGGVATRYYDPAVGSDIAALIQANTALIVVESPGSLTFEVQDVPAIVAAARAAGVATMIDNTWASPLGFRAIEHGVDIAMLSLTKYVGGHSDALMGSLTVTPDLWPRVREVAYELGQSVSADDCALMLRGLRTLDVRLARHAASSLAVAEWLRAHPAVATVLHPALPGAPGHDLYRRDFLRSAGLFAFALADTSPAQRDAVVDALERFGIGFSWGGYESLAIPADPRRTVCRWTGGPLIRLSIGLEDPADLIADLDQALATLR